MNLSHLTNSLDKESNFVYENDSVVMVSAFKGSKREVSLNNMDALTDSNATVLSFRMSNISNIFTDEI